MKELYCSYYTALVFKEKTWLLSGCIRNFGHVALERCLDKATGKFEFFVPKAFEQDFEMFLKDMQGLGCLEFWQKSSNRLESA